MYPLVSDMMARDFQGVVWSIAKGFDTFCPIRKFIEKESIGLNTTTLWKKVDGALQQNGSTKDMIIFSPILDQLH